MRARVETLLRQVAQSVGASTTGVTWTFLDPARWAVQNPQSRDRLFLGIEFLVHGSACEHGDLGAVFRHMSSSGREQLEYYIDSCRGPMLQVGPVTLPPDKLAYDAAVEEFLREIESATDTVLTAIITHLTEHDRG